MIASPALTRAGSYEKVIGEGLTCPDRGGNDSRGSRVRRIICLSDVLGFLAAVVGSLTLLVKRSLKEVDKNNNCRQKAEVIYRRGSSGVPFTGGEQGERCMLIHSLWNGKAFRQLPEEIKHGMGGNIFSPCVLARPPPPRT